MLNSDFHYNSALKLLENCLTLNKTPHFSPSKSVKTRENKKASVSGCF